MLGTQAFLWTRLYYTGDEPAYMMSVVSFALDGDFNLFNNYLQGDALLTEYPGELNPQWAVFGYKQARMIPAEHGTAFPLIVAIPFMLGRLAAVRLFMIGTAFAATLLIAAFTDRWTGNRLTGTLCMVLLAISPSWQMQASRVYPETLAAALTALALLLLLRGVDHPERESYWSYAAIGFIGLLLPVIYVKYVVMSAAIGLILLLAHDLRGKRLRALCAGAGFALALGIINVILWHDQGAVGGNFVATHGYLFSVVGSLIDTGSPFSTSTTGSSRTSRT